MAQGAGSAGGLPAALAMGDALRGKPQRANADVRQFIEASLGRHSAKPDAVRERLVRLMGDVPRREMFARGAVPQWDCWGDEVESTIKLESTR